MKKFLPVLILFVVCAVPYTASAAAFQKFNDTVEQIFAGKHDFTASGHVLKVYLSNVACDTALDAVKADIAEITMTNEINHGAGGCDVQNTLSETTGTATVAATDCVFLASGGSFGPFQYVVLYNDTQTSPADPLIGCWNYGSAITVNDGETFTVDFSTSIFTLQ